ncbi:amino acid adenylation domain-containing protein, partial [Flavobacterium collinsii]|uniref:amino acid adenylation domain-containing protein n=2 Tax=Flavobacterium collinsii TaxID=1114861 RepID=UPI0024907071
RLVGYVVVEGKLDRAALQEQLKLSLPEYMVPMIWVELAELPLTSNGKVDRKALPDPDSSDLSTKEYVAPRTETEHQLAQIWENLLGVEKVGVHDNFFELGGHSLLATRLVSMIRKGLSIEISIREVFEYATIATLSSHVSSQSKGVLLPAVVLEDRSGQIPLSFSQERLWFLDQLEGSVAYHIPIVLRLEGALDTSILEQTLQSIVSRHEVLRTILLSEDGIGYQEVISEKEWILDQVVINDRSLFENILQDYLRIPFDLSVDYKLRACLYDLGDQKYILACVLHHIASDGWSEGILVNEFMELYSALQSGRAAVLPELSLQYSDYAIWQRKYLEGAVLDSQLSYWEEKLEGVGTLSLPTDYARPSIQSTAGSNVSLTLDKNLSDSLNALCQVEGVTLFMLMLSAFKVLLSRYSGQDDICVGTPIANRTQSELEGMIGFFVNTLALRSDLSGNPDFRELLKRVKETTLGSYDHQLAPFEKVVDRVVTTRDMSMSPLFQVMFVLQNTPKESEEVETGLEGILLSGYEFENVTSQFDLILNVSEGNNGIGLDIVYCTDLFDRATIDRMMLHYKELLVGIVSDITRPISILPMLTVNEEHQLLYSFNDTTVAYPKNKTLVDLFEEQVKKTPAAIAVVYEGEALSYKELDEKSNQLANYLLTTISINSQCLIGVVLERSDWLIISFLAILKTGSVYVPIDLNYPEERKEYIKKDSGCSIIIDDLYLSLFKDTIFDYAVALPRIVIKSDDLAYVIYTSGSTGQPKGVMIEHKNLIHLCLWHKRMYAVTAKSRSSLFSGIGFDASIWEICPYLVSGASLYPISDKIRYDLDQFSKFVLENSISHSYIPTSLCESIIEQEISLPNLVVLTGGDVLRLNKQVNIDIYNNYGPTESTVVATTYKVASTPLTKIPIGKPIDNTMVYIMDEAHHLLPIGVIGELCIGGVGVARGYLNKEELTREKFISNPFIEGDRIYKTGDLARWLPDGNLEFIGRKDDQVKIRGYRIELGEIENVLSSIAGIIHCCVLAKEDSNYNKRLIGYVVAEGKLDRAALQEQLKLSLPEYMVPMIWVELAELPLTSNGKLDRKALPDPDSSDLSTKEYIAPRTETEGKLAQIWQNLLGVEKVGVYDNFFELGGHSLLVVKLVATINKLLNTNINIIDIFKYPTIYNFVENMNSLLSYKNDIMIPLQEAGNKKEIFLAPPGSGTINSYIQLVKLLGEDQPVYAFQSPGLDGKSPISKSIEEMASTFIIEMQKLNPSGPYRLGGYSFGGIVAYEMASQLLNDGFDVEELLIFDSSPLEFSFPKDENIDQEEVYRDLLKKLVHAILGKDFTSSDLVLEDKTKEEQITQVSKLLNNSKFKISEEDIRGHLEVNICNKNYNYLPREEKLDISIVLFRAMYVLSEGENEKEINLVQNDNEEFDYGWQRYTTKEVIVHNIPSTHLNMLDNIHSKQVCDILIDLNKLVL